MYAQTGAWSYANTYVDRLLGQPIVDLGPRDIAERIFYGPMPSTDNIITFRNRNLMIVIGMLRDSTSITKKFLNQITYPETLV